MTAEKNSYTAFEARVLTHMAETAATLKNVHHRMGTVETDIKSLIKEKRDFITGEDCAQKMEKLDQLIARAACGPSTPWPRTVKGWVGLGAGILGLLAAISLAVLFLFGYYTIPGLAGNQRQLTSDDVLTIERLLTKLGDQPTQPGRIDK